MIGLQMLKLGFELISISQSLKFSSIMKSKPKSLNFVKTIRNWKEFFH